MIARAKRAFSGMVMSVMIAAPALTLAPGTAFASAETTHSARPTSRKAVSSSYLRRSHASVIHASHRRSSRVASRGGRRGAEETASETAFVDDGGAWMGGGMLHDAMLHDGASAASGDDRADFGAHKRLQTGLASWYGGGRWQGNRTASGGRYDESELTAAHATLPLGTRVRVSTIDGSGSVVVRITDRPGTRRRIIDLSRAAASQLGILDRGVAMVSLETQ